MRISRLDRSEVDEQTAEVYDWFLQSRGNVPNMFSTVAHRPEIMQTAVAHLRAEVAVFLAAERHHVLEVHDVGAMDARETRSIENAMRTGSIACIFVSSGSGAGNLISFSCLGNSRASN